MADGLLVEGLVVRAGARTLVDGASLRVAPGEVVGLVGGSGAGKTITCRAILGIVDLQPGVVAGEVAIQVDGTTVRPYEACRGGSRRARDRVFHGVRGRLVGYLPQDAALDPYRRVGPQVAAAARLAGATRSPEAWLARAGFTSDEAERVARSWPHELSGGMAQRVVIAATLARGSRYVIADEPTTGLDAPVARRLLAELRRLADAGPGVLLVTHDLRWLAGIADRVEVMDGGRIVETLGADGFGAARSEIGRALVEAAR